jgi:hypothetical protein
LRSRRDGDATIARCVYCGKVGRIAEVVAFVNEQRSRVKCEIYHPWAESIELKKICAAAVDIPSASDSERRKFAVNSTDGNLSWALAACGDAAFPPGSVSRALQLSQLSRHWTASVMLQECVSFVTRNSTEDNNFDDRLFASRTEAAHEMSLEHDVDIGDVAEGTGADAMFEVIELHLQKREVVGPFEALGMSVKFSYTDDYYSQDSIYEIKDSVSGLGSHEIGLRHGCQVWEDYGPRRYNNSRCVETFNAEELREIFDRRVPSHMCGLGTKPYATRHTPYIKKNHTPPCTSKVTTFVCKKEKAKTVHTCKCDMHTQQENKGTPTIQDDIAPMTT